MSPRLLSITITIVIVITAILTITLSKDPLLLPSSLVRVKSGESEVIVVTIDFMIC
jgi:hypothetical protein